MRSSSTVVVVALTIVVGTFEVRRVNSLEVGPRVNRARL